MLCLPCRQGLSPWQACISKEEKAHAHFEIPQHQEVLVKKRFYFFLPPFPLFFFALLLVRVLGWVRWILLIVKYHCAPQIIQVGFTLGACDTTIHTWPRHKVHVLPHLSMRALPHKCREFLSKLWISSRNMIAEDGRSDVFTISL